MARSSESGADSAASDPEGLAPDEPGAESAAEMPFEDALARLEQVVDRLEQGDIDLEASLAAFEEGVRLSGRCAAQLDAAERRIEILTKQGGAWTARPFEPATQAGADPETGDEESG